MLLRVFGFFLLILLWGCDKGAGGEGNTTEMQSAHTIGVAISNAKGNAFLASANDAFSQIAATDASLDIVFDDANDNQIVQNKALQKMIQDGVQGLVVNLVDAQAANQVVDLAKAANIPVVFWDREPSNSVLFSYSQALNVIGDPAQAGIMQGLDVLEQWAAHPEWDRNKDGVMQYAILTGIPDDPNTQARTKWSISTIESYPELGTKTEQIFNETGMFNANVASLVTNTWLNNPRARDVEVILANNDNMAIGAIDAMRGRNFYIPTFGIDGTPQAIDLVAKGEMAGTVSKDAARQAEVAISALRNLIEGQEANKNTDYRLSYQTLSVPYALPVIDNRGLVRSSVPSLQSADKLLTIGVVVKIGNIPWFNAMEQGIRQQGAEMNVNAFMIGPETTDPEEQIEAIEQLIAQQVDVIGVVPNDAPALENVLAKAKAQGIVVITHESPDSRNIDADFELISNQSFGASYGELIAKTTGCEGKYGVFVGDLTTPAHNAWADAAIDYLATACPSMTQAGQRQGVAESVAASKNATLSLIDDYPDLSAVMGFGSQGPIGAAQAAKLRGVDGTLVIAGLFSANQGKALVEDGTITGGYIWSPLEAGKIFVQLGAMLHSGIDLSQEGFIPLLGQVTHDGKVIYGNQTLSLDRSMIQVLADMGL